MKMKMVTINIDDPRRFAPVALFLDQLIVRQQIERIRHRFGFAESSVPYSEFEKTVESFKYELSSDEQKHFDNMWDELNFLGGDSGYSAPERKRALEQEMTLWEKPFYHLELCVDAVLKSWSVGTEMKDVVIKSIVCSEVHDEDYKGVVELDSLSDVKRNRLWWCQNNGLLGDRLGLRKIAKLSLSEYPTPLSTVQSGINSYIDSLTNFKKRFRTSA